MKGIYFTFAVLIFALTFHVKAQEMPFDSLKASYYSSYDLEAKGLYKDAISALNPVYKNYPATYTVNFRLGWLYYLNGNYANALEHLEKSLTLSPSSIEVLNVVILVNVAQEKWELVMENSVRVLKIDYYNVTANYWYSVALRVKGLYYQAMDVDYKMLAVFPTQTIFLEELGENQYLADKKNEAQETFRSVLILSPTSEKAKKRIVAP